MFQYNIHCRSFIYYVFTFCRCRSLVWCATAVRPISETSRRCFRTGRLWADSRNSHRLYTFYRLHTLSWTEITAKRRKSKSNVMQYLPLSCATLAEGAGANRLQAGCPCLQMPAWISPTVPRWRTLPTGWHRRTSLSSLRVVTIADCPPNSAVNCRQPGFSGCCLSCLERSATARHGCRISACLLQSPQDSSL